EPRTRQAYRFLVLGSRFSAPLLHRRGAEEDLIAANVGGCTHDREYPARANVLRGAADHHLDHARLDHVGHGLVVEPELANIELECDRSCFARCQADALEALQLLDGPRDTGVRLM